MLAQLDAVQSDALAQLAAAADAAALEQWRIAFLGPKGELKSMMGGLKDIAPAEKPAVGARLNQVKVALEEAFKQRQESLGASASTKHVVGPQIDVTEPGLVASWTLGKRHILSRVREDLVEVFARMGFVVAEGPELEDDEHNFVKLNIPPHHPAREESDNFYVDDPRTTVRPRMLRSQTSTVQIRVMETQRPPIKVIAPGRVYRPDTVDATHSFMFHQIEGLCVDQGVTMADLKTTLLSFARAFFGPGAEIRLRPSYFPFTEPSAELDMKIAFRPDQPARWVELGGCGMVNPAVLEACGIDPEVYTGYAFGFGIERIAMGRYGIPDIRMLYQNDLRFLQQL
ncbi:MAG: phenylalanine--tRNA ligase subunit alpha [Phycisphaerales bacterium]|nr:phenylalanine--tRNA ligase subunit alpha [Phycisphaerales bacterium]